MSGIGKALVGVAFTIAGGLLIAATGGAAAAVLLANAGFTLAGLGVLEEVSKLFLPKPPNQRNRQDIEYTDTTAPRRLIYGEGKVSGLNTIRPTVTGDQGKYLHQILTIAGHVCEAITKVYFNETEIAAAAITAVAGNEDDGLVNSGTYSGWAWIRRYLGTQSTVDYKLNAAAPSFWTSTHIGYGVTYAALTYKLSEKIYANGKPDVAFYVQGKKCYDPRLDSSPGANPTTAAYIVYTKNPALHLADYLMDTNLGRGILPSRIDWALVVAAANICDENVTILPASSPNTTQKRYTSFLVLDASGTDDIHRANIQALASAMMGVCYRQGGKYRMYAGAAQSPTFALTEADIVGDVSIRLESPLGEKYNFVRGTFRDSTRNYQDVEYEPRGNAAYEDEDNARLPKSASFANVTNPYEAQRNAIIVLRRSRMKQTLSARFALTAYGIRPFIVGTMTFADIGWDAKRVVCTSWKFVGDGSIEVTLQEDDSSIWSDPTTANYTVPGSGMSGTAASYVPDPCSGLITISLLGGIKLKWDMPLAMLSGDMIEVWEIDADSGSDPFTGTKVHELRGDYVVLPKDDTLTYVYGLRVRAENGNYSSLEPASGGRNGVAVDDGTYPVADPDFLLSTTNGDYWDWDTATGITLSNTGGNTGGVISITGNSTAVDILNRRAPKVIGIGRQWLVRIRLRRTGTITSTGGGPVCLSFDPIGSNADESSTGGVSPISGTYQMTDTALNALTVNAWTTISFNAGEPTSSTWKYLLFRITRRAAWTGGTVEIGSVFATPA